MRNAVLIFAGLFVILLFAGCGAKQQNNTKTENDKTLAFINKVKDADVWILPETEENLKTTLWGTPTAAKVKAGENRSVSVGEPGGGGKYIFRMIDTEHFYYSANGISLEEGWSIEIKGEDMNEMTLEVSDENGDLKNTYEVFAARL